MARFFLSYRVREQDLARRFQKALQDLGHQVSWDVDALLVGSGWRDALMQSLASSEAVVPLLTPEALQSQMVISEVGAARAFATTDQRMALLPVLLGLPEIPSFIQDLFVLRADLPTPDQEVLRIASEIDRAISAHLRAIASEAAGGPQIFVSHRHKDEAVARALTDVLQAAFELGPERIRCTSVQPFRLPFGRNTSERLRDEIKGAKVVLGILAPDTAESSYVMFELGAAWGRRVYTCPLLTGGADFQHIPSPIADLAPARLWVESDCQQLVGDLATQIELRRRSNSELMTSEKIRALARAAAAPH
ncbi:MAG: TIR domain-containing protein [Acidobacteria bacterium]|nr:TIR domain-containing protein [Acidobacteriota bacterium]